MATVVVIGAGNAGIAAALSAREAGADVLVLEWATEDAYGSDSRTTTSLSSRRSSVRSVLREHRGLRTFSHTPKGIFSTTGDE